MKGKNLKFSSFLATCFVWSVVVISGGNITQNSNDSERPISSSFEKYFKIEVLNERYRLRVDPHFPYSSKRTWNSISSKLGVIFSDSSLKNGDSVASQITECLRKHIRSYQRANLFAKTASNHDVVIFMFTLDTNNNNCIKEILESDIWQNKSHCVNSRYFPGTDLYVHTFLTPNHNRMIVLFERLLIDYTKPRFEGYLEYMNVEELGCSG